MAKQRVIAHFMHEYEEAEARIAMPGAQATESYLVGEVEENDISRAAAERANHPAPR